MIDDWTEIELGIIERSIMRIRWLFYEHYKDRRYVQCVKYLQQIRELEDRSDELRQRLGWSLQKTKPIFDNIGQQPHDLR